MRFQAAVNAQKNPSPQLPFKPGDRLLLNVSYPCTQTCQSALRQAIGALHKNSALGLDVYFPVSTSVSALHGFAKAQKLPVEWVNSGRITLAPLADSEKDLFPEAPYFLLLKLGGEIVDVGSSLP